jgi:phospholipid transport system substrate-binding protein
MQINNRISKTITLSFIAMLMWVLMITPSFAVSDPVAEVTRIADQLIAKLKANKATLKENPALVYSLANTIIVPHADISEMSKRVLPAQTWNNATSSQRQRFQRAFTNLLVHTYASALANYNDQTLRFYPVRGGYAGRSTVQVKSVIERPDGPSVAVDYRLILRGSSWKLFDLNVEGVSMLESFRSQFADQLSQGNIDALITKLSTHNSGND